MELPNSPNITSFILRFVHAESQPAVEPHGQVPQAYRGTIRHIPSGEELDFTRWEDAVQFIHRYVPIELFGS